MEKPSSTVDELIAAGARRLLNRAVESRSLDVEHVQERIAAALQKYLLRFEPNTPDSAISTFIDELQADDLCLIIACERSDEDAWNDLVERFTPTVKSAARSASSNEDAAEELAQSIWAELFGLRQRKDGKPATKLAYYSGRGSLAGWLRAVVAQLAIDSYRKQSRLVQAEEDSEFDRLGRDVPVDQKQSASIGKNPEQAISDHFAEADMQDALNHAVASLTAEDRLLIKLYYFDNLRLREAGAVLGVHEATASRRLSRVHSELRRLVSEILVNERGWTQAETERSFSELAQNLDADLETILSRQGAS